jgi:hypothetical protein
MAIINDGRSGDFDGHRSCHVEWYVPACKAGDRCIQRIQNSWELPWPIHIAFLRNHFHAGGINMTTYATGFNCTGFGTYDERNDLVDISTCVNGRGDFANSINVIERGERIYVEAFYQQDQLPHYGVMGMSFVYAHIPRKQDLHV